MNLQNLFELQKQLDEHIEKKHPRKEGEDRLSKKILALQVELAECAQESRCFKFWSSRQEPVTEDLRVVDYKESGEAILETYNPLLEEYVDCLHFILSIGLEKDFVKLGYNESAVEGMKRKDITSQFNYLFDKVGDFSSIPNHNNYMYIVSLFIGLGEMLGFTWEQIEQAYLNKNNINHQRQEENY